MAPGAKVNEELEIRWLSVIHREGEEQEGSWDMKIRWSFVKKNVHQNKML